jgi:DNA primase
VARYTVESVERVKDAIDMVDLVGSRTELRRAGANRLQGLCPFHEERTPSFGIDPVQKVFHCFGCNEGGSAVDFVMKTEGVDFKTAIELLADRYRVELELEEEDPREAERRRRQARLHELLDRTAAYYERVLWESSEGAAARSYLEGRGLSVEALRRFRVGYSPSAWDRVVVASRRAGYSEGELQAAGLIGKNRTDRFRERIMFPLWDFRGRVVGFGARAMEGGRPPKDLNTSESPLFHKGRQVYGAHLARAAAAKAGAIIVVEGYTDVIALHQADFDNVVCTMGTAVTEDQVRALRRLAPTAYLAMDADNAGQEAMLRAARVAAGERLELRVIEMPAGLDPAEVAVREGADGVRARMEKSMPFVRFRVLRTLDTGDVRSAEGKDHVLDELRPVFAELPASVLRSELLRTVSDRLDVPADLVEQLLRRPRTSRPSAPPVPRRAPGGPPSSRPARDAPADPGRDLSAPPPEMPWMPDEDDDPGRYGPPPGGSPVPRRAEPSVASILARTEEAERRFLQFCIALPGAGNDALQAVDVDEHFSSALTRRAALHLREHLHAPAQGIAEDDEELRALIREFEARNHLEPPSAATLDAQRLQLEIRRIRRRMQQARESGEGGATALAVELQSLQAEFDKAMERAIEAG